MDKALHQTDGGSSLTEEHKMKVFKDVVNYLSERSKQRGATSMQRSRSRSRDGKSDTSKESGEVSGDDIPSRHDKRPHHRGHSSSRSDYKTSTSKKLSKHH